MSPSTPPSQADRRDLALTYAILTPDAPQEFDAWEVVVAWATGLKWPERRARRWRVGHARPPIRWGGHVDPWGPDAPPGGAGMRRNLGLSLHAWRRGKESPSTGRVCSSSGRAPPFGLVPLVGPCWCLSTEPEPPSALPRSAPRTSVASHAFVPPLCTPRTKQGLGALEGLLKLQGRARPA